MTKIAIFIKLTRKDSPDEVIEQFYYTGQPIKIRNSGVNIFAQIQFILLQKNQGSRELRKTFLPLAAIETCLTIKALVAK